MTALVACATAVAVTWLLRVLPITVGRSLPHVGPAVLAALVAATVPAIRHLLGGLVLTWRR